MQQAPPTQRQQQEPALPSLLGRFLLLEGKWKMLPPTHTLLLVLERVAVVMGRLHAEFVSNSKPRPPSWFPDDFFLKLIKIIKQV